MADEPRLQIDPIAEAQRQWERHGWAPAAEGMALVTSLVRAQQIFVVRVERALRPLDLTFARYEVLMVLHFSKTGSLPLGKIGARLQVQPGAVTNVVDRLQSDGLVVRRAHPTDARMTLAALTDEGRHSAGRATRVLNEEVFERTGLSMLQTRCVVDLLRDLRRASGDF